MERKNLQNRSHRLRKRKQFSYVYRNGRRKSSTYLTLFTIDSKFDNYLIGFSINKAVGKAHTRNKVKRRLREIVRTSSLPLKHKNYVLMTRSGVETLTYDELRKEVEKVFEIK